MKASELLSIYRLRFHFKCYSIVSQAHRGGAAHTERTVFIWHSGNSAQRCAIHNHVYQLHGSPSPPKVRELILVLFGWTASRTAYVLARRPSKEQNLRINHGMKALKFNIKHLHQMGWHIPFIPALERQRQRQADLCELETRYLTSSRPTKAIEWNLA